MSGRKKKISRRERSGKVAETWSRGPGGQRSRMLVPSALDWEIDPLGSDWLLALSRRPRQKLGHQSYPCWYKRELYLNNSICHECQTGMDSKYSIYASCRPVVYLLSAFHGLLSGSYIFIPSYFILSSVFALCALSPEQRLLSLLK